MLDFIKKNLMSNKLHKRITTTYLCFIFLFTTIVVASYYLLPEGLLRNKNPLQSWENSSQWLTLTLQIFFYNLISVIVIIAGNLVRKRKNSSQSFLSYGYLAFFVFISINALVLGTWSFSVVTEAIPLMERLLRTFDLVHRAGLWEMSGQILILCATVNISLIIADGKMVTSKNWKTIRLSYQEVLTFLLGLCLMLAGAMIESNAILTLS